MLMDISLKRSKMTVGDPEDTKNDTHTGAETSPRDKEVWSVGKACWRPK